jgi:hypothetical protein
MRQPWVICCLLIISLFGYARRAGSQADPSAAQSGESYSLHLPVDEVNLTFHAADAQGLPINDLKLEELSLLDNGKPPRRIFAFHSLKDNPIRAGILLDSSESMEDHLPADKAISIEYAQRLLRQQTDQAFVMDFGYISKITQSWTNDPAALSAGIHRVVAGGENPLGGQRSSTPSIGPVFTSLAEPIALPAEMLSCSSPTAQTTPVIHLLRRSLTFVSACTLPSTPFARSRNPAPSLQARGHWRN